MFRRAKPRPPSASPSPFGAGDPRVRPPGPALVERWSILRVLTLLGGGIAWGAAVHFADSLPADLGVFGTVLKIGSAIGFVVAIVFVLLTQGFEVGRVAAAAACVIGGAVLGSALGPGVPPAITVQGDFTFVPSMPAGMAASQGSLECEWANGRWKIGELRAGVGGFGTPHVLTVDFLRKTVSLADGSGSTLRAVGSGAFVTPADAPPRGEGDRSGVLDLLVLQVDIASVPADPNEVRARFTWSCPAPPSG